MTELDVTQAPRNGHTVPAPPRNRVTRRGLQIALGIVWLLDGALQLQPFMFGPGFAGQVLAPAGQGQPGWVAAGVNWAAGLVGAHPAPWTVVFAIVQLALGAGLLWRPLVRIALIASVAWSAGVWYFGEGLGGLASGHASLLTGAPGAVVLYALLAFVVWPDRVADAPAGWRGLLVHDSSGPPAAWTSIAWAVVWVGGAVLQALPGQNTPADLAGSLTGDMPAWQMGLNNGIANHVLTSGAEDDWLLLVALLAIGLCGLAGPRLRSFAGWAGAIVATVFWLVGQGFGDLFSGQATDPNSGPLLIFLSLALLGTIPVPVTDSLDLPVEPVWRRPALTGVAALAIIVVGMVQWATTMTPVNQAHLAVSSVYTPTGDAAGAPVYFTLANTGNGPDTLTSAGTEFQTAGVAKGVTVCANPVCSGAHSVTVPAHSTMTFGPAGPHLVVAGLGALAAQHQPLQVTLTFATSGVVHVLSPVGSPADLTENDVMTYGFMGHRDPGMDMPGMADMPGMPGMPATPTKPGG